MTKMGGIMTYTDRGDPASPDFDHTTLTTNGNWQDLDLSSIIAPNAKAVVIKVLVQDGVTGSYLQFRKKGNSNDVAVGDVRTQAANVVNGNTMTVPCDADGYVQYRGSNLAFTAIDVTILGWFA